MSDDPVDAVAAFWAKAGNRTQQYLDVWSAAAAKNAAGEYSADDLMVDLEKVWGMSIADATAYSAGMLAQLSSLIPEPPEPADPQPADGPADEPDDGAGPTGGGQ